jgi:hypothetical protein
MDPPAMAVLVKAMRAMLNRGMRIKFVLNSLLNTLKVSSKANGFVEMDLQKREEKVSLSAMSPTAIFNRFDLTTSPLALMSVLNSLSCHGLLINELERT